MRIMSIELAGTPEAGNQLPRAFATLRRNFEGGHIYADVYLPNRARAKTIFFSPDDTPTAERSRHNNACALAMALDGVPDDTKAYLQIVETMLAMGSGLSACNAQAGPAAEPPAEDDDDTERFAQAVQDCISPEAVAVIAAKLQNVERIDDPCVNSQVEWFAEAMAAMVGGIEEAQDTARQYGIR